MTSRIATARVSFHQRLSSSGVLTVSATGIPSNADSSQRSSISLAAGIYDRLPLDTTSADRLKGQTSGRMFESAVADYVNECLGSLQHLRPAQWTVENVGSKRGNYHLAEYVPYRHLNDLAAAVERDQTLQTVLGNSYNISPDVLVLRQPLQEAEINRHEQVVDADTATRSPIRASTQPSPIVHGVISCKWTLRSDRAQNARSEALGLLRNRKGRAPHIAVVTGEPSPSRLASLALGTGDIDTVYHFALPELISAAADMNNHEPLTSLMTLVDGERLRDISDLPLDLVI